MKKKYEEVSQYYDKLWADLEKQNLSGINSRHRIILNKLVHLGLNANSSLLEIGCGIGTLTNFISKKITNGLIVGADISPESIEFAKNKYSQKKNIVFVVTDMTNFTYNTKFDFVLLPDVLEHIPIDAHSNIFKTIRELTHKKSIIAINIPNPFALEWFHKYQSDILQIIDQPIHTDKLLNTIYNHHFYLETLETYSIYYEQPDYQWLVLRPTVEYNNMTKKSKYKVLLNNLRLRLSL